MGITSVKTVNLTTSINMKASFLILSVLLGLGFSSGSNGKDSCTQVNVTITGIPCGELCAQLGKNYYWCRHSGDGSWDYCSLDEKTPDMEKIVHQPALMRVRTTSGVTLLT